MGSDQAEVDRFVEDCKKAGFQETGCKEWGSRERPHHRVTLDAYYIDRYEVTNALLRAIPARDEPPDDGLFAGQPAARRHPGRPPTGLGCQRV